MKDRREAEQTRLLLDVCGRETPTYPESLGFWARTSRESQMHKSELLSAAPSLSRRHRLHPPRVTSAGRRHFLGGSVGI